MISTEHLTKEKSLNNATNQNKDSYNQNSINNIYNQPKFD